MAKEGPIQVIRTFCKKVDGAYNRYYIFVSATFAIDQNGNPLPVVDNSIIVNPNLVTSFIVSNSSYSLRIEVPVCDCGMVATLINSKVANCLGDEICFSVNVTGGKAPYSYFWLINGSNNNPFINNYKEPIPNINKFCFIYMGAIEVQVIVTDSEGCKATSNIIKLRPSSICKEDSLRMVYNEQNGQAWIQDYQLSETHIYGRSERWCQSTVESHKTSTRRNINEYYEKLTTIGYDANNWTFQFTNLKSILYNTSIANFNSPVLYTGPNRVQAVVLWEDNIFLVATENYTDKISRYYLFDTNNPLAGLKLIYTASDTWFHGYNATDPTHQWCNRMVRHGNKLYHIGDWDNKIRIFNISGNSILSHKSYPYVDQPPISNQVLHNLMSTKFGILSFSNGTSGFNYVKFIELGETLSITFTPVLNPTGVHGHSDSNFSINKI